VQQIERKRPLPNTHKQCNKSREKDLFQTHTNSATNLDEKDLFQTHTNSATKLDEKDLFQTHTNGATN
jgi:hypothetical protein